MARQIKHDLMITLKEAGGGFLIEAQVDGKNRVDPTPLRLDFADEVDAFVRQLQSQDNLPANDQVMRIGQRLYDAIFLPAIQDELDALRGHVDGDALRIRLVLPETLAHYPWEALHDGTDYLAVDLNTPLVRTFYGGRDNSYQAIDGKLKVLFVGATSPTQTEIDIEQMVAMLTHEFIDHDEFSQSIDIEVYLHKDSNREALLNAFNQDFHVLCFVGHGGTEIDENGDEVPVLYLWSEEDGAYENILTPADIAGRVNHAQLRLVLLLACQSGVVTEIDSFANALTARAAVSATVTMQTFLPELQAQGFLQRVLSSIMTMVPIDMAVADARRELNYVDALHHTLIAPVLYLQSDESNLFRRRRNWVRVLSFGMATLAFLLLVTIIGSVINTRLIEAEAERNLNTEQQLRLQSETQRDRSLQFATGRRPNAPLLHNGMLWVSHYGDHSAQSFSLTGDVIGQAIPMGEFPGALLSHPDSDYLWASSDDGQLTRIDPVARTSEITPTVANPFAPLVTADWVWVASTTRPTMVQVAQDDLSRETVQIPRNIAQPIVLGDYVWVKPNSETYIVRFHIETRQRQEIPLDTYPMQMIPMTDSIWVQTETMLYRINGFDGRVDRQIDIANLGSLNAIQANGDQLWLVSAEDKRLYRIPEASTEIAQTYDLPRAPDHLYHTPDRLWVASGADQMLLLDEATGDVINALELRGANQISGFTNDGQYAWFTTGARGGLVQAVRIADGVLQTRIPLCQGVSRPLFDGTNVWFACPNDDRLEALPAVFFQFDIDGFDQDTYEHQPLVKDDLLWISIEQGGRVLAYDQQQEVHRLDLGAPLLPLQADDRYIWTAVADAGILVRIEPYRTWWGAPRVRTRTVQLPGETNSFDLITGKVWLPILTTDFGDTANLFVIDAETMRGTREHTVDRVSSSIAHVGGDDVWLTTSGYTQGRVTRFSAATGDIIDGPFDIPDTSFGAWSPVVIDDLLWFTAGAPSIGNAGEIFANALYPQERDPSDDDNRVGIAAYDPDRRTWLDFIELINVMPSRPVVDGNMLWMSSFGDAVPVIVREQEGTESGIWGVNVETRQVFGAFENCDFNSGRYLVGDFLWVGCSAPDTSLMLISRDAQNPQIVRVYDDIGSDPWSPVVIGDYAWFVFNDTDNAAAFHIPSGELMQIYQLGPNPAQPVLYNGDIWVYNTGDGSLQRIISEITPYQ